MLLSISFTLSGTCREAGLIFAALLFVRRIGTGCYSFRMLNKMDIAFDYYHAPTLAIFGYIPGNHPQPATEIRCSAGFTFTSWMQWLNPNHCNKIKHNLWSRKNLGFEAADVWYRERGAQVFLDLKVSERVPAVGSPGTSPHIIL
ncbi:uncharacterized protein [Physcomitrium patens]